ncbi:MAG TPA: hypothetical protein VGV85_08595, partial [Longimicrobiaceae bacterium]|nr:hypothetical protein [Longimicrobiaceae bacterium]
MIARAVSRGQGALTDAEAWEDLSQWVDPATGALTATERDLESAWGWSRATVGRWLRREIEEGN